MHWKGLILSVFVAAVLYATLFAGAGSEAALAAAARVGWHSWLLILSLSLFNYGLRFGRWDWYLRYLGHRLPALRHGIIYLAGFALTTTPAKAGEAVRALYLKPLGVGYGRCLAVLYTERLVDAISIALLGTLLLTIAAPGYRWIALAAACIAGGLLLVQRPGVIDALATAVSVLPLRRGRVLAGHLLACLRQAGVLTRAGPLLLGLVLGLVSWGAEAVAFYHIAHVLDVPIGPLAAIGVYATAMLAGALSFVPGGLGSTEAVMMALLVLAGASLPTAVAVTTIVRIATLWFAVALGVAALAAAEAMRRWQARPGLPLDSGKPQIGR